MVQLVQLGQLHNIINQTQQIASFIIDFLQKARPILRLHQTAQHDFRIAQHALQRRLQLVRHIGRKLAAQLFRGRALRHIHNQKHKALIRNTAAVTLVIGVAAVDDKPALAHQLHLLQQSANILALHKLQNILMQKLLFILAKELDGALV